MSKWEEKHTETLGPAHSPFCEPEPSWVVISIGGIWSPPSSPSICRNGSLYRRCFGCSHILSTHFISLWVVSTSLSVPLLNSFVYNHLSACRLIFLNIFLTFLAIYFKSSIRPGLCLSQSWAFPWPDETAAWRSGPHRDGWPNGSGWNIKAVSHRDTMCGEIHSGCSCVCVWVRS